MESMFVNDKEYRLVTLRGRSKWIASDGSAINPVRKNQKASIHINRDGYPCFGGGIPVHLYVANGWVDGYFDGAEVDHIDFDRTNYNYGNLRWVSHSENIKHSSTDTDHYSISKNGENNGRSVLTTGDVKVVKDLFSSGIGTSDVIRKLFPGICASDVRKLWNRYDRIKKNATWSDI